MTIPDAFYEGGVHSPAFLQPNEIYCYDSELNLNGCTLTGKLIDMQSTEEWIAEITSCSVTAFSSHSKYAPFDDEGNYITDGAYDKTWQGSYSGNLKGIIECSKKTYYEGLGNNVFIVTIKAVLDIPLTCTDGRTMESESVIFEGQYTTAT